MKGQLQTTIVFQRVYEEYQKKQKRIIILEGGTGSSKTISLAQLFCLILIKERGVQLTIARKTLPSLKATAMRDFFNQLKILGAYREEWHNKSENVYRYRYTNSEVDFISIDEPIKIRSRYRDYLWLNEANEFSLEDYRQLSLRTKKQIFMDYNPSHMYHWIYDEVHPRQDAVIITSTYLDNPFLPKDIRDEIESYKEKDLNYWRVYGLGLRAIKETLIYQKWNYFDELPENYEKMAYGLDFGYNNPSALGKVVIKDQNIYWEEKLYQSHLTNADLIEKIKPIVGANDLLICDSAEPSRIEELRRAGFNVRGSIKTSVRDDIDLIKSKTLFIGKESVNLLKEIKNYNWREKEGKVLDEPVKENDHLLDACRYATVYLLKETVPELIWI